MTPAPIVYSSFGDALPFTASPLLRGDGLFETLKVLDKTALLLDRHLARLTTSARALGFDDAPTNAIRSQATSLAQRWEPRIGRMRITLLSDGGFFITVEELVDISAFPVKLGIARDPLYSASALSGHKSLSYGEYSLHHRSALKAGLTDLVLTNERNEVVETTIANIFVVMGEEIFTPPLESGALPGVARGLLLELDLSISERPLILPELFEASAIFLSSSLRGISEASLLTHQGKVRNFPRNPRVGEIARLFVERQREESSRKG